MKVVIAAVLFVAALVVPASAGFLTIRAGGDNPNAVISVDGKAVEIFPDGSSPVIRVGNTARVSIVGPGVNFEETITSRGVTVYQTPVGARVSPGKVEPLPMITPAPPSPPSPPVVEEKPPKEDKPKDNNSDGSKNPKRNK